MKFSLRDHQRKLHEGESAGPINGVDILLLSGRSHLSFIRDLHIDGELICDRFVIPPGGAFMHTKGSFEKFPERKYPAWAPQKLMQTPTVKKGPYSIAFGSDRRGDEVGGHHIAPYCMSWRSFDKGYAYMLKELVGVVHRMPVFYEDSVQVEKFALQLGWDVPVGYTYDMEDALRWDPDAQDYLQYHKVDGAHYARATRAWFALRDLHPVIEVIGPRLLHHVKLSWEARDIPEAWMSNDRLWTIKQWLECPDLDRRRTACGRELAHVYRLVKALEPDGKLALGIENLILSCGIPWYLDPADAPEARTDRGGPWEKGVPLAHTFQLLLMQDAIKGTPTLVEAARAMHEFLGPTPEWTVDAEGTQWSAPGGSGPNDYALFRGDIESAGYPPIDGDYGKGLLHAASGRGTEDAPLDCCPNRFWAGSL